MSAKYDWMKVVATGKVRPAEKRNIGIKAASGSIVAFIDDDAYPEAHWLEYAVKYFFFVCFVKQFKTVAEKTES